jgi:hypothetical protein
MKYRDKFQSNFWVAVWYTLKDKLKLEEFLRFVCENHKD